MFSQEKEKSLSSTSGLPVYIFERSTEIWKVKQLLAENLYF